VSAARRLSRISARVSSHECELFDFDAVQAGPVWLPLLRLLLDLLLLLNLPGRGGGGGNEMVSISLLVRPTAEAPGSGAWLLPVPSSCFPIAALEVIFMICNEN
jgi:hypothetical protein